MRNLPKDKDGNPIAVPAIKVDPNPAYITQKREYELITPLFGGGVEPGTADPLTVIRATEIRGHLRFWWRATRGGQFEGDLQRMKAREDEMWGAASTANNPKESAVKIVLQIGNDIKKGIPFEVVRNEKTGKPKLQSNSNVAPPYAAFPLQPTQTEMTIGWKSKPLVTKATFSLTLTYPEKMAKEIEAAIWAWELFGGLGARTRRGFGAISLLKGNELVTLPKAVVVTNDAWNWLKDELEDAPYICDEAFPHNIPYLRYDAVLEITDLKRTAHEAWTELINALKDFRQQRPDGDPKNGVPPKRSKWPEPEYIRDQLLTDQRLPKHQALPLLQGIKKFPRAAFGLPIIFQFKDRNKRDPLDKNSDPRSTSLRLENSERLASPLILRPLKLGKDKFVGVAIALDGVLLPEQMKLQLEDSGLEDRLKRQSSLPKSGLAADLDVNEAKALKMKDGSTPLMFGKTDVIVAFLEFLKSRRRSK